MNKRKLPDEKRYTFRRLKVDGTETMWNSILAASLSFQANAIDTRFEMPDVSDFDWESKGHVSETVLDEQGMSFSGASLWPLGNSGGIITDIDEKFIDKFVVSCLSMDRLLFY